MKPLLASLFFLLPAQVPAPEGPPLKVFLLVGQSNMVGFGEVDARAERSGGRGSLEHLATDPATAARFAHLRDEEGGWRVRDDVWISFFERRGPLGVGFGSSESTIGPELGFGHVVGDRWDEPVLLLKVAWGGKSVGVDFRPPTAGGEVGHCYRDLFAEVRRVMGSLEELFPGLEHDGVELCGIGWHQGWNDRVNQALNDAYEENLSCFIRDARRELGHRNLPFVIAETGMSGHAETHPRALSLMKAQAAVAARPEFRGTVSFVGTKDFFRPKEDSPSGQAYHWNGNAETYYLIGDGMGNAMCALVDGRAEEVAAARAAWAEAGLDLTAASSTTAPVLDAHHPILFVAHDAKGGAWQFLCGTTNEPGDARVVPAGAALEMDPSLAGLADLPAGWIAERESVGAPWRRRER